MPVKIPDGLPAVQILEGEGVSVIPESRAFAQDIRPLRVAIANIMPLKSVTETQLLRLLSASPLQVAVTFLHPRSHTSKNTATEHLEKFYRSFADVQDERFDCLIITGAPVEEIPFEQVAYWDELRRLMDWSRRNVYSTLHICWGAQAGLYHHHGIQKYPLPQKLSGVFAHVPCGKSPLLRGFDERFFAPHSRHTGVRRMDILRSGSVKLLAMSEAAGVYLAATPDSRQVFVTGHPEYDRLTLLREYERDCAKGEKVPLPENYFPDGFTELPPPFTWRSHAHLLFGNWLDVVYQHAPFKLSDIVPVR